MPFFAHSRTPESNETGDFIVDDSAVQSALLNNGFIPLTRNLDMLRSVLLTYTVYSFELGYVQGMNDLLAPILIVMQNEPDSFSCFVNYMETQKHNFYRDQTGMRKQLSNLGLLIRFLDPFLYSHLDESDSINLFCCFRWILTNFKREFEFEDTNLLWESEWACPFTSHFHLFFALAILNTHRQNILTKCHAFDETLKYCNDLSGILDCKLMIYRAEVLFHVFKLKITETARTRLGIDLETGISTREESEPGAGEKLVLIKETTPTWADADADLGLTSMSESELYDLISLLEKV